MNRISPFSGSIGKQAFWLLCFLFLLAASCARAEQPFRSEPPPVEYANPNQVFDRIKAARDANTIGVMMVPYTDQAQGDYTEQTGFKHSGDMPCVDRVYAPTDGTDMFAKLAALKTMGKKLDVLVLLGHASEGGPIVLFGNGNGLKPEHVGVFQELKRLEGSDNKALLSRLCRQAQDLQKVRGLMTPGAKIFVFNCYAAHSAAGIEFLTDLGNILLGDRGGQLIAATTAVEVAEQGNDAWVYGKLWRWMRSAMVGRSLEPGDAYMDASMTPVYVKSGSFPRMPSCCGQDNTTGISGRWRIQAGGVVEVTGADPNISAFIVKRSSRFIEEKIPDRAVWFTNGKVTSRNPLTIESDNFYAWPLGSQCTNEIGPFKTGHIKLVRQSDNTVFETDRAPNHSFGKCAWIVNGDWSERPHTWVRDNEAPIISGNESKNLARSTNTTPARPAGSEPAQNQATNVAGVWKSDFGPVTIEISPGQLRGHWNQAPDKLGQITDGTFDNKTGTLIFNYYEPWNQQKGSARLQLSGDGRRLTGTWKQSNGQGAWNLSR